MITKNKQPITSLVDWFTHAGPKRQYQWQEGRSAMEAARAWLDVVSPTLPNEIDSMLSTHHAFGQVLEWSAEPEVRLPFDELKGEPRNTDLLVRARDEFGKLLLAIEAKADEPFGETLLQANRAAHKRSSTNERSRGAERIRNLCAAMFGASLAEEPELGAIRYQLLTGAAGAMAASIRSGVPRVVFLVQEFRTSKTVDHRHEKNATDLNAFVSRLTGSRVSQVEPGSMYGPISIPGGPLFPQVPPFFIGKVSRDIR